MKIYPTIYILFLSLFIFTSSTFCQEKNASRKISLQIDDKGFFSNNEYDLSHVKGYTLIGNRFTGKFNYTINPKFSMYLGMHLLKYNGLDGFYKAQPIIGLQIKPISNLTITMGSYDITHRDLPMPLYHWERTLTNFIEEGVYIRYHSNIYNTHLWLNWDKFILHNDPFQEHFTVGWTHRLNLIQKERFHFTIPLYTLFDHHGGQIDSSDNPVNTIFNAAAGFEMKMPFQNKFFNSLNINALYFYFNQTEKKYPHNNGNGYLSAIQLNNQRMMIESGYWKGNHFYAPMGSPLFQSVAYGNDHWARDINEISYLKIAYHYPVYKHVDFQIGSHIFYMFPDQRIQYTYELSIHFTEDFFIYGFKK